jgi:prefoldin subunit 5
MLSLIDSLVKDRQMLESEMLSVEAQIKTLQERYKRLDRTRENLIHAINELDEVADA